jgi:hypothetical protein
VKQQRRGKDEDRREHREAEVEGLQFR